MTWPQIYVLVFMIVGLTIAPVQRALDRRYSSANVAVYTVLLLVLQAVYAWVLHEGGFW